MEAFINAMAELGLSPTREAGLVICQITPDGGARADSVIEVGVSKDELTSWPLAPPHWIHLPADIKFTKTNTEPSSKSGWLKHSRNIPAWGNAPPATDWEKHLHAVLREAIR